MQDTDLIKPINIGSRGSPLALVQARLVQRLIGESLSITPEQRNERLPIHIFKTTGDKLTGRLSESGGKGLFVKELDEALASGNIDLAVHSMKDVPTTLDPIFSIAAILEREDPRDAFISVKYKSLMDLPKGAILGTASLRRQAQAGRLRPDLKMHLLRGNVGTRITRLNEGMCDATFLAVAGLNRLNQADVITAYVGTEQMLPAPAQGAVGIQTRSADIELAKRLTPLHHAPSALAIMAERSFLAVLDGSCRTPIAALAQIDGGQLTFRGQALSPDGVISFQREQVIALTGNLERAAMALGEKLGADIKREAAGANVWTA